MSVLGIRDRVLTLDEARRIAVNVAKLPGLMETKHKVAWQRRICLKS